MASEPLKTVIGFLGLVIGMGVRFVTIGIVAIGVPNVILPIGGFGGGLHFCCSREMDSSEKLVKSPVTGLMPRYITYPAVNKGN